jgi:hypothetical protein
MSYRLLDLAVLAGLATLSYRSVCCSRDERRKVRPRTAPEHIQTWEGEGGGVPIGTHRTAAQVEPASTPGTDRNGG